MSGVSGEYESAVMEAAIKDAVIESGFNLNLAGFVKFLKNSNSELLKRFAISLFFYLCWP